MSDGPGIELFEIIGFLFQIVLVYTAFILLPFSKAKGEWK